MSNRTCTQSIALVLAACALLSPRAGLAANPQGDRVAISASTSVANRLDWVSAAVCGAGERVEVRQRMPRRVMAYSFRLDVNEAQADDAALGGLKWDAELIVVRADIIVKLHFTESAQEQSLPRPLGVELMEGDSVIVKVTLGEQVTRNVTVRLTMDHETNSVRIAGKAVRVDRASADTSIGSTWEWTNAVDGVLYAVAGAPREGASEMRLVDLTSRTIVWSDGATGDPKRASAVTRVQRFSVPVIAGHHYRLEVERRSSAAPASGSANAAVPMAIVVPSRAN